jgi:hypothetical protein
MLIVVYLHFVEVRGRDDQIRKRKFFPTGYQSRVLKCQQVAVTVLTIRMDGPQEYEVGQYFFSLYTYSGSIPT